MKLFMKILISTFVLHTLFTMIPFESTCQSLEQDVLRLHILANSDSVSDQSLKLKVRDDVIEYMSPLYIGATDKSDAIEITQQHLSSIEEIAQSSVYEYGYNYSVDAKILNTYFDTRYYDDFTMPAGMYDALQISIGDASGKNWWCVMYPSLCVGASSKESMQDELSDSQYKLVTNDEFEYEFKIVEYFEKLCLFFR